jgi:MarR family transcriptional regulator, organic hydroperoxide resistance regulator
MKAAKRAVLDRSPSLPPLGDVLDFMAVIWKVEHALQRTSKRMESTIGVTGPQRLVIRIVGRFPGISAGALAELLHVHPSTLTGVLKRLARQGIIRRRSDPRDARRSLLALTAKGRLWDVERKGTVEAAVRYTIERTSPADLRTARDVLKAIAQSLHDQAKLGGVRHGN